MINSRALLITFLLIVGFMAISVRLFNIQVLDHNRYAEIAKNQQDKKDLFHNYNCLSKVDITLAALS